LIASEYQGTYLKSGKKISLQDVERKINSAVIIQQRIRIFRQHHCINQQQQQE
jgi:hypothetical protein